MKKYLAILLSLALVFCFISCDGSTKTPDGSNGSSSGSVTAVPKDSNVPDKSKLKPLDGNGVSVISEISSALNRYRDFKLQADIHKTTWYKIGGGQILEYYVGGKLIEQGISGSYSEKYDVVINDANQIDTITYDGTIIIGGAEYTLSSLARIETDKGISFAGQVKKEGTGIDVSTLASSDPGLYYFLTCELDGGSSIKIDIVSEAFDNAIFLLTIDKPDFVGAASFEAIKEGKLPVTDVVLNFSKVRLSDGKNHSLTCNYKIDPNEEVDGNPAIKVIYFSLDGTYFTPESISSGVLEEMYPPF